MKFKAHSHWGGASESVGQYQAVNKKLAKHGTNPAKVIKLGLLIAHPPIWVSNQRSIKVGNVSVSALLKVKNAGRKL